MSGTNLERSKLCPKSIERDTEFEFKTKVVGSFQSAKGKMYLNGIPRSVYSPYLTDPSSVKCNVEMVPTNSYWGPKSAYKRIDNLLEYIFQKKTSLNSNIDFVCARNLLRTVMSTPTQANATNWEIMAIKHEKTIYLASHHQEYSVKISSSSSAPYLDGFQFEDFLLTGKIISQFIRLYVISTRIFV